MTQSTKHICISPLSPAYYWLSPWNPFQHIDTISWAPQTFMHCGPCGAWIENSQSNHTERSFVEGVFMTNPNDPSSSQKPNLALMFFKWYPNILIMIESYLKQEFKLKMPKEYDCDSHSQCQLFTLTTPTSILTQPLYPAVFSLSSKQELIQLPSGSDLPMINTPSSLIKKLD
ncbi:hypothetical protein O181_116925 [Austropuccinia psidii MF-1]|uniref:Uncharacterized protein n=1 Tax=Austropuccinia psidii MF-1 TaxID=1389203 RepID=A0A9Q3KDF1_9BASI|nr:hypothetical protein [Austropuccinia psidii MF-1]